MYQELHRMGNCEKTLTDAKEVKLFCPNTWSAKRSHEIKAEWQKSLVQKKVVVNKAT